MSAYHLSVLRNKGWMRLGLVASVVVFPIAMMEHALGFFADGVTGLTQAGEFIGGGIAVAAILTLPASWVLRGFVVRHRDADAEDEEVVSSRPAATGGAGRGAPPAAGRPAGGRPAGRPARGGAPGE